MGKMRIAWMLFWVTTACGGVERHISTGNFTEAEAVCDDLEGEDRFDCYRQVTEAYIKRGDLENAERCCHRQGQRREPVCLKVIAERYDSQKLQAKAASIYLKLNDYAASASRFDTSGFPSKANRVWAQALVTTSLDCVDHALSEEACDVKLAAISNAIKDPKRLCKVAKIASTVAYERGASVTLNTLAPKGVAKSTKEDTVQDSKRFRLVGDRLRDYVKHRCSEGI